MSGEMEIGAFLQDCNTQFLARLRKALGLFDGAMSCTPKEAMEECIARAQRMSDALETAVWLTTPEEQARIDKEYADAH